jgi:RNA polymerase sigma factor (sigma-70 family)
MANAQLGTVLRQIRRMVSARAYEDTSDRELLERFLAQREEAAFVALLRRHGPMVFRVCRRIQGNEHDAEDAFQATFLLLARKAGSIRKAESVASWLHGVAHRLALEAKEQGARRQARERRAADMRRTSAVSDQAWQELQATLDEALRQVSEKYRAPLLLCYLEGKTQEEAARQLGCPLGTVRSRLARGRDRLRAVLQRHGVRLTATALATALAGSAASAAVPSTLLHATARVALEYAAGVAPAALVSARAAALLEGGLKAMMTAKLKMATAVVLVVGTCGLGAGTLATDILAGPSRTVAQPSPLPAPDPKGRPGANEPVQGENADQEVTVSGRVVDPDGKPFAGAKVFFTRSVLRHRDSPPPPPPTVTSDAEGRFRLRVSRTGYQDDYEKTHWLQGAVVAVGAGFAPGWVGGDDVEKLTDVTVQLGKEVPITGRVVDLQGQPLAGVSVQVRSVRCRADGGDLNAFVEALRAKKNAQDPHWPGLWLDPARLDLPQPAVTGADGKFRLAGLSGECLVGLRFSGPTIETAEVYALTRPAPTIVTPRSRDRPELGNLVYHGNTFDHAAAPTRPVSGVVRDRDTGKPLAGVTIQSRMGSAREHFVGDPYLETTTDAEGRYRLVGLSREGKHHLEALPAPGQPYLPVARTPAATPGMDAVTVSFTLKRGVLIRGRVTDKATGRPVPALVKYFAFADNPHLREAPGLLEDRRGNGYGEVRTAADGSFTVLGLPGRGLLAAKAADRKEEGRYLMGVGADDIKGPRFGDGFDTEPGGCDPVDFNTLAELNPAEDAELLVRDLVLDPGKTVAGTIVGPDGQPVKGASIESVRGVWLTLKDLPTAEFRVPGVDPKHPRWYFVRHPGRNLGAVVLLKGDEPMPVTVRLQKCATITGRLVDDDGLPRSAWLMSVIETEQLKGKDSFGVGGSPMQRIGKDGRFRIEGVLRGHKIGVYAGQNTTYVDPLVTGLTLKEGEVKDLGDVKAKPGE